MIGFIAAVGAETSFKHPTVAAQFGSVGGFLSFLFVSTALTVRHSSPRCGGWLCARLLPALTPPEPCPAQNSASLRCRTPD